MKIKVIEYKDGKETMHKTVKAGTKLDDVCEYAENFMSSGSYFADRLSIVVDGKVYADYES